MDICKLLVVGAGQMGSGIAQLVAQSGIEVLLNDVDEKVALGAKEKIRQQLDRKKAKGQLNAEDEARILDRIRLAPDLSKGVDVDVVIEAVVENEAAKKELFKRLDEVCPARTILASNTSSISITKLATATRRPENVIGMHFFNPAPVMKLVEIVRGLLTSPETIEVIRGFAKSMDKQVILARDFPGFLSVRLGTPTMNDAFYAVYQGLGSVADIDTADRLGLNHPMGPLELADFIGLDTVLGILDVLYEAYGEQKYFPCPLLRQMVAAGHFGRKSGKGFYDYSGKEPKPAM